MSRRPLSFCLAVFLPLSWASPAAAGGGGALSYHVVEQSLADAARTIGQIYATPVVVDPAIDVVLRDRVIGGDMPGALRSLGAEFGLFVYSDGARYHVLRSDKNESRLVKLGSLDAGAAQALIAAALPEGAVEARPDIGTLLLRGPREFITAAEAAIKDPPPRRDIEVIGFGRIKASGVGDLEAR
jgi:type II secretory pathway component GspD/PulD (secretin)